MVYVFVLTLEFRVKAQGLLLTEGFVNASTQNHVRTVT